MSNRDYHMATCVACGCDDNHACAGGCSWLAVNRDDGTGVCSNCPRALAGWRAQQADQADPRDALIEIGPTDV